MNEDIRDQEICASLGITPDMVRRVRARLGRDLQLMADPDDDAARAAFRQTPLGKALLLALRMEGFRETPIPYPEGYPLQPRFCEQINARRMHLIRQQPASGGRGLTELEVEEWQQLEAWVDRYSDGQPHD